MNIKFALLISLILITYQSYIVFPFKTIFMPYLQLYKDLNKENITNSTIYNSSLFFDDHYFFRIFTHLKIGTPQEKISSFINPSFDSMKIGELLVVTNKSFYSSNYNNYQYTKSTTFLNVSEKYQLSSVYKKDNFVGEETLYLYTSIQNYKNDIFTEIPKILFITYNIPNNNSIYNNETLLYCLNIGIQMFSGATNTSFLKQMHNNGIINSYTIAYDYINETDGIIVIGKYPHEYAPEKYNKDNYKFLYTYKPTDLYVTSPKISFSEIFYYSDNNNKTNMRIVQSRIELGSGLIIGTSEYLESIEKNFFNYYYNEKICSKYITKTDSIENYIIISCDIQNFKIEKFPTLNFYLQAIDTNFNLNYKDLFKKINNRYYFSIVFEEYSTETWKLGNVLLRKYTFVFDVDAKIIGFYDNKKQEEENTGFALNLTLLQLVIIIVLLVVFIGIIIWVSFYIGKKMNINKKFRANELNDDNYDYSGHEDQLNINS